MKSRNLVLAAALLSLILTGCSKPDPVSVVKGSTLSIDKSATIGNVFDNYKYFKSVSWEAGQDEQKREIVTFKGKYDLDKFADASATRLVNGVQLFAESTAEDVVRAKQNGLDFIFIAQFRMAVDGSSFDIGFAGIRALEMEDGKRIANEYADEDSEDLAAIYKNRPSPTVIVRVMWNSAQMPQR